MENNKSKLFFSLERILNRTNLDKTVLPTDIEQWQKFLEKINNSFLDFEQERYLLERSMEISSKEMLELNERLESAQSIAHIGYWLYNQKTEKIVWSKETYRLFGLDLSFPVPSLADVMKMIHVEDRLELTRLIERALTAGMDYEKEVRIHNAKDNKIYWVYIKGHPYKDKSVNYLSGIIMDITERKLAEEEFVKLNQNLISLSRQAGMSEIATSVLHNIGNVLNSVNISVSLIHELVVNSKVKNLNKTCRLISENIFKHPDYLMTDRKGKLIPEYLSDLSQDLLGEHEAINKEVIRLNENIQHIKDIVLMQKDISGTSAMKEKVFLPEICDLAIQISCVNSEKNKVQIERNYKYADSIRIEKAKLTQILVNLISNAKDSVLAKQNEQQKKISIIVQKQTIRPSIKIIVKDNGIGIPKNRLDKIFTMGFTTKTNGHGFGLHSSAIEAQKLQGSLTVESDGNDKGATFTLTLPLPKNDTG